MPDRPAFDDASSRSRASRLLGAAGALVLLASLAAGAPARASCSENSNAWFIGVVFDAEQTDSGQPRNDFALDVDNFEDFKAQLQATHCFGESQSRILAFKNNYTRNSVTYPAATERAVKNTIAEFGAAAAQRPDPMLFFFLSSHGIVYPNRVCAGQRRVGGSLSALGAGQGQDGDMYDCELGEALTNNFPASTRMLVAVDCSFCGGFSDSLTAASGTIPDNSLPTPSGIVRPNRIVITGCAMTTECFGSNGGGVLYKFMRRALESGSCDGWTAPLFPLVQGIDLPERTRAQDGRCDASELLFGAVAAAYDDLDPIAIQEQFRIKYGFATLAEDLAIA